MSVSGTDRPSLRRRLRAERLALDARARHRAALGLTRVLAARPEVRRARRVAIYLPQDGEIDPLPTAEMLRGRGKTICLPLLDPVRQGPRRLRFAAWYPDGRLEPNRFGILEPADSTPLPAWTLDLVLLPLVGFDAAGNRLGMGAGFYDRTFDPVRPWPRRPLLIGLAHGLQQVDALPVAAHDVPLHGIATDQGYLAVRSEREMRRSDPGQGQH